MNNYITNFSDVNYDYTVGTDTVDSSATSNVTATEVIAPVISLLKESCVKNVKIGERIEFTVTATNSGNGATPDEVTITDLVPAGVTLDNTSVTVTRLTSAHAYVSLTKTDNEASIGANEFYSDAAAPVTVTMPALAADTSYILKFTVTVNGVITDPEGTTSGVKYAFNDITNQATAVYDTATAASPLSSNTVTITSDYAYLAVANTALSQINISGDPNYQITITNYGNTAAANVTITDDLPKGFQFASATITDHITVFSGETDVTDTVLGTATFDTTKATTTTQGLLTVTFKAGASLAGVVTSATDPYVISSYRFVITGTVS